MLNNRGQAYVLAVAIYAGNRDTVDVEETSDRIYKAININPAFSSDEARADVYAQLAEKLTATTPFAKAVEVIEAALFNTELALRTHG
jgi:hypothetical protein